MTLSCFIHATVDVPLTFMNAKLPQKLFSEKHTKQIERDHQYSSVKKKRCFQGFKNHYHLQQPYQVISINCTGPRCLGKVLYRRYSFTIISQSF